MKNTNTGQADAFLMAAAAIGLFPREKSVKMLTESAALDSELVRLERRLYRVRFSRPEDLPAMLTLEERCWAAALRASPDEIENRVRRYSEGQLVLEMDGVVCGVIYSQRIHNLEDLTGMTSDRVGQLHADGAPILQLLALNILPEYQQMKLGDQLLDFMLLRACVIDGVQSVAAVTLCKRYSQHREYGFDQYIRWRTPHGKLHDPILRFHELNGAVIQYPIPNYRPSDRDNDGYGVLVTYDLQRRQRDEIVTTDNTSDTGRIQSLQVTDIERRVRELITGVLGVNEETEFATTRPLMEMGLNSADLISLGEAIRVEYKVDLESTFFFQHNTLEKVARYLSEQLRHEKDQETIRPACASPAASERTSTVTKGAHPTGTREADIAIVGIGCRLPVDIHNSEQLWEFLVQGRDAITQAPADRWQWPAGIDPRSSHPGIDCGGFLTDIARFDARFFRVTPREAQLMDPQQRILLELTWETLEDAGVPPHTLTETKTGVFVGASGSDYALLLQKFSNGNLDAHVGTGAATSILANRISYFYDLRGPSVTVDTACSSSLVAVHQAMKSLRSGECEQALVAGINVMCHPGITIAYYKAGMLARDGRCKTFDKEANGYVRSEGAVMVFLKPLPRALAECNFIYAVIKGSATNHGGQAGGLTVPNPGEQSTLILDAWRDAGVSLDTMGYLETHGTGTSLGDPIEIKGVVDAFARAEKTDQLTPMRCGIGSIKTNLGHLEAAAGIAGMVKAALSLSHALVPKHRNFKELNPHIALPDPSLFVVEENTSWPQPDSSLPRRAGVSSFGSGGACAHVVLEEFRQDLVTPNAIANGPWLFTLSAKTAEQLHVHAAQISSYLRSKRATLGESGLQAIAYTLQTGREAFDVRLAVTAASVDELVAKLDQFCAGQRNVEGSHYGDIKDAPTALKILAESVSNSAVTRDALRDMDFNKIGALWSAGVSIPWQELYADYRPEKCFLPTYPFASDHYWFDVQGSAEPSSQVSAHGALHPLLDTNVSTFAEQKYRKRLHREEVFIKDHVVRGLRILPGVAHLEMARAAAELSLGQPVRVIKDVIWGRPVVVEEDFTDVAITLHPDGNEIGFEIQGENGIYSRGKIVANNIEREIEERIRPASFDLNAIRQRNRTCKTRDAIFAHLENLGFKYGPSFQLTDELVSGETEAVVRLVQNHEQKSSDECRYQWDPTLLDSAIRTPYLIGIDKNSYNDKLRIPFSLGRMEAFSSLDNARYAYARTVQEGSDGDYVSHVSILDERGVELLVFENLLNKSFRQQIAHDAEDSNSNLPLRLAKRRAAADSAPEPQVQVQTDQQLFDAVVAYLKEKISTATKAPIKSLRLQEPLSSYGINSVMIMELNRSLETDFESLPGTLFFQFGTVHDLANYFISNHADRLREIFETETYSQAGASRSLRQSGRLTPPEVSEQRGPVNESGVARKGVTAAGATREIAIIGMSGRYPKANSLDQFWENLKLGVDAIEEIPGARWDQRKYYSPTVKKPGMTNSKWGGFIENVEKFDAAFFKISPREANYMDPQQRLFLEVAWAACEDAGYRWERTKNLEQLPRENNVGVFVGLMYDDYHFFEREVSTSYWNSFVANRVSHFFNFRGPSMTVDTACSSSLTSIYLACESLRNGHCYAAIAGGTNLTIHPRKYARLSQLNMLSNDGKCKSFGKDGDGYVPGEGVGAVLLKRLGDAVRDEDHIYAVIKGGALNHGGKTNGFTVPNPNAQAELILAAIEDSGISPRTISYVEAHGTGTKLGDPIEIAGLTNAFRKYTADRQFCSIGSVKSNIGHLEGAAGIAAVTKVALQLHHQQQVPSLHARVANPLIDFQNSPFTVAQELAEWKRPAIQDPDGIREYPRRAGISSFGAGGANAHVILEEYIEEDEQRPGQNEVSGRLPALVPLSAKTKESLKAYVVKLLKFCQAQHANAVTLERMAYTLQTGRQAMEWRVAFLANDLSELCTKMAAFLTEDDVDGCYHDQVRRTHDLAGSHVDDEQNETVRTWMAAWRMDQLAQLWVKGVEISWEKMYGNHRPRRMSLPTYPFAGERYWVPDEEHVGTNVSPGVAASQVETQVTETGESAPRVPELMTLHEEWKPEPLISGSTSMTSPRVVYFGSEAHPPERFAAALQSQGVDAVVAGVECGEEFTRLHHGRYQIHPTNQDQYRLLFDALEHDGFHDYVVVYRWADGQKEEGIRRIYSLVSAVGRRRHLRRVVLTGSLGDDLASCYDVSWIGYERSLKLALPSVSFTLLYGAESPVTDNIIILELGTSGVIRYRADERFRLAVAEIDLASWANSSLRKNGVYVISGGCGGLGELFAEHLAKNYQARLVLFGRTVEDDGIRRKLARLAEMGATPIYCSADVSDPAAMRSIVEQVLARFGRMDGIIHAAGLGPSGSIFDKQWNDFEAVLKPKLSGSIALAEAAKDLDPDFICYFSSSSAVLGDFGSCDYSIGNRFQMAFGAYCQSQFENARRKCNNIVINWPLWRDGGMTVGDQQQTAMYLKSSGQRYLEREEGLRLWELVLDAGVQQVLVFAGDTARITRSLTRLYGLQDSGFTHATSVDSAPATIAGEKASGVNTNAPSTSAELLIPIEAQIAADIRASVSKVLNLAEERIEDDVTWGDFGFDSITLGELGRLISDVFKVEVAPSLFFSYSTIEKLCSYLVHEKGPLLQVHHAGAERTLATVTAGARASIESVSPREVETTRNTQLQTRRDEEMPIAITGLAGRFPGARNPQELWAAVVGGEPMVTEVPAERWNWRDYYFGSGDSRNRIATNRGCFIADATMFDPLFFEISPREAALMDPRQRLFLQEAWHAFEDAGYSGKQLRGSSCGVFIGVEEGDHSYLVRHQGLVPGNHSALLAARISYYLDLHGANLAINTSCSSGLVALHLACQSLRSGECDMALAGAINLLLSPAACLMLSSLGMLSRDGPSRPFDERATGMVPAEAVGAVVLRPLARAIEDRDHVYAVIRGSGINYDGRSSGITAPNSLSQAALLDEIFARYQIDPGKLQLVMAHSTGSPLGDPVEVQALSHAIRKHSEARQFCALTSIKHLVGHSFAASGIVNLIVTCMAMKHEMIPAIHCEQPNSQLDLTNSPFYLNQSNATWKRGRHSQRTALVGGTGMSGTNAFIVLEDAPAQPVSRVKRASEPERDILVVLSAKTPSALDQLARELRQFLIAESTVELDEVAYTTQVGREPMTYRAVFLVRNAVELIDSLDAFRWGESNRENCFMGGVKKRHRTAISSKDETLRNAIQTWKKDGHGATLAQMWTNGAEFDWELLYDDAKPNRISLPTYPFARRHFGLAPNGSASRDDSPTMSSTEKVVVTRVIKTRKKICVVGAGPSGLVMAKSLREEGHEPVIYEKQDTLGGLWVLRREKSGGAYRKTRFQTSKYTSVFSDYFLDDIPSTFYRVDEVKSYLDRYAKHFQLDQLVHYNSEILSVRPAGARWSVALREGGSEHEDEFDGVAMCHGMFWKQQIPGIRGFASFRGTSFHSGQYYDNSIFAGKRVLVIGNGVSGMDIAEEASEVADRVFWSMRSLKLILPRMVGFVPNDCNSVASLLLPSNRAHDVERLRYSMPDYFRLYERSGLLPSRHDLECNPTVHINDNVVRLVAEGRIEVFPAVVSFGETSCQFADQRTAEVDVVVFCTGYDSTACEYLPGIQPGDFSMGIFYHRNPTLVNALGHLPIAFSGSFFFCEMVARWYAQVLSGKYRLSEAELRHRLTSEHRAVSGPVASVMFGLKLGLFPSPETEFKEFWRLLNYPPFPMVYRLRGEHANKDAPRLLEEFRKRAFVKTDEHDPELKDLKRRILAGFDAPVLDRLLASGEITAEDHSEAQLQRDNALKLEWDLQYIKQAEAPAHTRQPANSALEQEYWPLELREIFEQVKTGTLDADQLIAALSSSPAYV